MNANEWRRNTESSKECNNDLVYCYFKENENK